MINLNTEKQVKSAVIAVSAQNFASVVLKAELPVIVDFSAEWCPPCRVLTPLYARLAEEYSGKMLFASLDVDAYPDLAGKLGVQGMPTLIIFQRGEEIKRLVGPHPARLGALLEREFALL